MKSLLGDKNFYITLILVVFLTIIAKYISDLEIFTKFGISFLIVAILLGMVITNIFMIKFPKSYDLGFNFCTKNILRFSIILYGFRLTFSDIAEVGIQGIIISCIIVFSTFIVGYIIGVKILKLDRQITMLTSAGSAICGAAAVLATEGVLKNKAYKTAIAVSTVVLFGTISMFLYPYLYKAGFLDFLPQEMGVFLGAILHEVAHVVGGANAIENEIVVDNAVIVKMIRVMFLAPFLIILSFFIMRNSGEKNKSKVMIPWFAVYFILVVIFNSFDLLNDTLVYYINETDTFLLAMAMMVLGLKTDFKSFKEVGIKPFLLAIILFIWLFFAGYSLVNIFSF